MLPIYYPKPFIHLQLYNKFGYLSYQNIYLNMPFQLKPINLDLETQLQRQQKAHLGLDGLDKLNPSILMIKDLFMR